MIKKHCATVGYVATFQHEGPCIKFVLNRIDEFGKCGAGGGGGGGDGGGGGGSSSSSSSSSNNSDNSSRYCCVRCKHFLMDTTWMCVAGCRHHPVSSKSPSRGGCLGPGTLHSYGCVGLYDFPYLDQFHGVAQISACSVLPRRRRGRTCNALVKFSTVLFCLPAHFISLWVTVLKLLHLVAVSSELTLKRSTHT